jgi:hypothetical protein
MAALSHVSAFGRAQMVAAPEDGAFELEQAACLMIWAFHHFSSLLSVWKKGQGDSALVTA